MDDFNLHRRYTDLPTVNKGQRLTKLKADFVVHATTDDAVPSILEGGLQPRSECLNEVWSDQEHMPVWVGSKKVTPEMQTKIQNCRQGHVYFYDDTQSSIEQALITVGTVGYHDPAVLLVKADQKTLKPDMEVAHDRGQARSLMKKGRVAPSDIMCVCTLKKEEKPDTGVFLCPIIHYENPERDCLLTPSKVQEDGMYGRLGDPENWECKCRKEYANTEK